MVGKGKRNTLGSQRRLIGSEKCGKQHTHSRKTLGLPRIRAPVVAP